jgi:glycine betaine/proline transport system substrate-binding protein
MKKSLLGLLILTPILFSFISCDFLNEVLFTQEQQAGVESKEANLVYVSWEEGIAYTNLAKVVLEDKLGYDVTITAEDVASAYTSVAQGNYDAFMEAWLPVLHKPFVEEHSEDIVDLGHVFEGTQSGLVVPEYVTIDKISELNEYADEFGGKITGINASAGVMVTLEEELYPLYDIELVLMASSVADMTAALQDAVQNEEWIVVTGWTPHSIFGRWDLKFLEQDSDKQVWEKGNLHIIGRKNIREDKPKLAQFLSDMFLTEAELGDLIVHIADSDLSEEAAAREWMNDNEEVVEVWLP